MKLKTRQSEILYLNKMHLHSIKYYCVHCFFLLFLGGGGVFTSIVCCQCFGVGYLDLFHWHIPKSVDQHSVVC